MATGGKSRAADSPAEIEAKATTAALELAAEHDWHALTLLQIAQAAGLDLGELRRVAADKTDLLRLFLRRVDAEVLAEDPGFTDADSVRDRLFDLLMRRFDALQPHKPGIASVLRATGRDPVAVAMLAPFGMQALGWYLEAAGVPADGARGMLRIKGLAAVWLAALRTWLDDDTADLSRTMAALDRALARAERGARWLEGWTPRGRRRPGAAPEDPDGTGGDPGPPPEREDGDRPGPSGI